LAVAFFSDDDEPDEPDVPDVEDEEASDDGLLDSDDPLLDSDEPAEDDELVAFLPFEDRLSVL
jgi:hypothetical protein